MPRDQFTYDHSGQLNTTTYTAWNGSATRSVNYGQDALGNRSQVNDNGNVQGYSPMPNYRNQYATGPAGSVSNGVEHEVVGYQGLSYGYRNDGRLASVSGNGSSYALAYDALGRCVKRTLNGTTIYYTYDGPHPIYEWKADGTRAGLNLYGQGVDEILLRGDYQVLSNGQGYFFQQNSLGSVTQLTGFSGETIESYRYDAFGMPTTTNTWGIFNNRFKFTGREYQPAFGIYEYRARAYHPGLGRFLSEDPTGFGAGDTNLFRYCGGDPVNKTDPTGLSAVKEPPPKRPVDGRFSLDARDALTGLGGGDWFSGSFTFTDVEKALHQADVFMNAIASLESLTFGAAFRDSGGSGGDGESGSGRGQYIPVLRFNEALAHYMGGSGSTIQTNFNQLSANIRARDFPLIAFLINASHNWPGTLTAYVSDRRAFSTTGSNNQNVFGNVTFRLTGVISATNGSYSFSGRLSALNDRYNFDPKPSGARTLWNEFKTWAGSHVPGRPYEIQFVGDRPFSESGP